MKPLVLLLSLSLLAGCASKVPPSRPENLCSIFREKPSWYKAARKAEKRWKIPMSTMMAIMYQESSYRHNVRPPRPWFLFIPLPRRSSAYGYPQAQDATWQMYLDAAGGWFASRDDFDDAIDFIGWYSSISRRRNKVSRADHLYLNYHEGWGGYARGSWRRKAWLKKVSFRVYNRAERYAGQLRSCRL